MTTLIAIGYPEEGIAEYARETLSELESERAVKVDEVAVITCDEDGRYHVHTTHGSAGSIWSGFWGELFGHPGDERIDPAFQQQVREHLRPGTSALLMLIEQMTREKAIAALHGYGGTVIETTVADEDTAGAPKASGAQSASGGRAGA